jgi:hypothetical protein
MQHQNPISMQSPDQRQLFLEVNDMPWIGSDELARHDIFPLVIIQEAIAFPFQSRGVGNSSGKPTVLAIVG